MMRASLSVAAGLCAISCNAVSVSVVTSGDTARMDAAGAEGKARRLPGAAVIHVTAIPPAGALTPIAGYITGLDNPADYQVCIYLESTASGTQLYNGPKPYEDEGSMSPVMADGTFNFVNWWANDLYDREAPYIYIVVNARAYGNCDPVMGVPIAPETLPIYNTAAGWLKLPRVNNIQMYLTGGAPALGVGAPITGRVTGLPEVAENYKVLLYRREPGAGRGLTGPLPACGATAGTLLTGSGVIGTGNFEIIHWADGSDASMNADELVPILMPSVVNPVVGSPQCVENALPSTSAEGQEFGVPPGVLGPRLTSISILRTLDAPAPTPEPEPSAEPVQPSAEPEPSHIAMPTITGHGDPADAGENGTGTRGASGASGLNTPGSLAVALATLLLTVLVQVMCV